MIHVKIGAVRHDEVAGRPQGVNGHRKPKFPCNQLYRKTRTRPSDPGRGRPQLPLNPELVHSLESRRVLALEDMPKGQIGHRTVTRESRPILQLGTGADVKTEQGQFVLWQKSADVQQRETMLLGMKQQI